MNLLTSINLILTSALVALIWTIQLVHYPLFRFLHPDEFCRAMEFHQRRISWVVMPLMLSELFVSLALAALFPEPIHFVELALVILIWLSTFFQAVPLHQKLCKGMNHDLVDRLVLMNWPRTIFWSVKLAVILLF